MNWMAQLAMLSPSPEEEARLEADLQAMTAFARQLSDVSAPALSPAAPAPLRADTPGETLPYPLPLLPLAKEDTP